MRAFQELLNFYLSEWLECNKIPTGYESLDLSQSMLIGQGTCGAVYSGVEVGKTNRPVVIKLMQQLSSSWVLENEAYAMSMLQHHGVENVAQALMVISPFNAAGLPKSPVALVMPYYGVSLYTVIREYPSFCFIDVCSVTFYLLQTLTGLKKIRISHSDLSASNVVVDKNFKTTVIDWSYAERVPTAIKEPRAALWYRAPECLIKQREHDEAVDMWSFGCLLIEMVLKKPAFPATDEKDAMSLLRSELGMPSDSFVYSGQDSMQYFNKVGLRYHFFEPRKDRVGKEGSILRMTREGVKRLGGNDKAADAYAAMVAKTLRWDPKERILPDAAMRDFLSMVGLVQQLPAARTDMHLQSQAQPLQTVAASAAGAGAGRAVAEKATLTSLKE